MHFLNQCQVLQQPEQQSLQILNQCPWNSFLEKSYTMAGRNGNNFYFTFVIPVLKSINIQIAAIEFSGQPTDKIHPRIKDVAKRLVAIYFCTYPSGNYTSYIWRHALFDAVCHSFSTLSTGGFSTITMELLHLPLLIL